ncbi:MAG: UDP-N-acetylglucosamine 2-epimerase [Halarcobacter ebronensis]|uniref:UDP-N-acetylglucosamine 2-epimerase n=1 Tax=Halarcobacter ebronensis TaxID=1462615 RepID=UPI003C790359
MIKKKILFLTGTRADFGKLKSLIKITQESELFDINIFATGMHLNTKYGYTVDEIYKSGFRNIFQYINHDTVEHMDRTLAQTINGFSMFVAEYKPDLIVIHGDRVEALAGAIVGSLNNILVAHIEGGEISGTIDESIRHATSKLSHIHLVANEEAKNRLIQLGEFSNSVHVIGSPDLDLMKPSRLPSIELVKDYYDISFKNYAIGMFHPVTTEYDNIIEYCQNFVEAIVESNKNYILVYPNNDIGSNEILNEYSKIKSKKIKIFPSLRFEYFLRLLEQSDFIIGNSSAGIREAPFYNIPTIDIGTRQLNRAKLKSITHTSYKKTEILDAIKQIKEYKIEETNNNLFGEGNSDKQFLELLLNNKLWEVEHQKQFQDFVND